MSGNAEKEVRVYRVRRWLTFPLTPNKEFKFNSGMISGETSFGILNKLSWLMAKKQEENLEFEAMELGRR